MKRHKLFTALVVLGLAVLGLAGGIALAQGPAPAGGASTQAAVGTAFTYQGRLTNGSGPVNGTCDFKFTLFDAASGGSTVGSTLTKSAVTVTEGTFTAPLDFGAGAFAGEARWLRVQVRCPAGSGSYTTLSPRQALTPAPYALALPGLWTEQNATSPNIIGGYSFNSVASGVNGAVIGGGGGGISTNGVTDDYGTVSGGSGNQAGDNAGTTDDKGWATVGGGSGNTASGSGATVGGGMSNTASGDGATVGGGDNNHATRSASAVSGGASNFATGIGAFVGGGGFDGSNFGGNQALAIVSTIGGGYNNVISDTAIYAFIGGGVNNVASRYDATIGGGAGNTASGGYATIGGGSSNTASNQHATVGGGDSNTASGDHVTIGGGYSNTVSGGYTIIGGGSNNTASGDQATIGGGYNNTVSGDYAIVGGGDNNIASGLNATVGGGAHNTAAGPIAAVHGGALNVANGYGATVGGGSNNAITTTAQYATIPGGYANAANGEYSFAAGKEATADDTGSFVWSDTLGATASQLDNQFLVQANGGVLLEDRTGMWVDMVHALSKPIDTSTGAYLSSGGTWTNNSDRNLKENFTPVEPQAMLKKVAQMPVGTWNYKAEDPAIHHIGPMAQDFYAAFGLGQDDTHIGTIDADGVALAAIQALYAQNQEQGTRIEALQIQNETLRQQLADLEARFSALEAAGGGEK